MKSRNCGMAAVVCILAALAIPVGLAAADGDAQITILQTTDLHHHANGAGHVGLDVNPVTGTSTTGAYARIATYVNYVRATAGHPVVLVDSGDWTMGTLYDFTLGTRPLALNFLKLMRYDCVTLGNHEFDYTPQGLARILSAAQNSFGFHTPIVASNMNLGGDADLAPFVGDGKAIQTTRVQTLPNGIKVGYIGLMGKDAAQSAPGSLPITFTDPSTAYAAIQGMVDGLRKSEGVQIVIVLSHSGTNATGTAGEDVELARHVAGIDVIASGHTHTPLASAHTVTNGAWNTQIIDAGFYGANVARIDLTYHALSKSTTLDASSNLAMTNASLAAIRPWLGPSPIIALLVRATDQLLNIQLAPFFTQAFSDYNPVNLGKGIYHPVGTAAQDMVSNEMSPVPAPNGLGDLAADALRSVPNGIIAQTLAAAGGNPDSLPGYDFTPIQAAVVATGVIRGNLPAGVPLSFADVYNVLPLGISPDSSQALPLGFPLVSAYLDPTDVQKVCALQLVAQSNLASSQFYLNLSGLQYGLKDPESYEYFKYATAAGVLEVTSQKAANGSTAALDALSALSNLASDRGTALKAASSGGNSYAAAMVKLNDTSPTDDQVVANLSVLGQVAAAAAADSTAGTNTLSALLVSKAVAAIGTVSGFAPSDGANTGSVIDLPSPRVRLAVDLSAILLLGALQTQFGVSIATYASASGPAVLSVTNLPGLLANRIDAAPGSAGVQELKPWMALLSYIGKGLEKTIGAEYASTPNFAQFAGFGAAVKTRNSAYPAARIGQLVGTLTGLQSVP